VAREWLNVEAKRQGDWSRTGRGMRTEMKNANGLTVIRDRGAQKVGIHNLVSFAAAEV
jgi:hypothetical protein